MLNSTQLEQLKIESLQPNSKIQSHQAFPKITSIIASSANIKIMGSDSNANIRSFVYVLLCNLFASNPRTHSPHINLDSESSSDANKSRDMRVESENKLEKIKEFLYSEVANIPSQIERVIDEYVGKQGKSKNGSSSEQKNAHKSLYMKKIIIEFLTIIWKQYNRSTSSQSVNSQSSEPIFNAFSNFGVADPLFCIFIRAILLKEYDIQQAADYTKYIPDHTVYTSLSDAFGCPGLKLEDHQFYLCGDYYVIYSIPFLSSKKEGESNEASMLSCYLISINERQADRSMTNFPQSLEFQTFRQKTRKSSNEVKKDGCGKSISLDKRPLTAHSQGSPKMQFKSENGSIELSNYEYFGMQSECEKPIRCQQAHILSTKQQEKMVDNSSSRLPSSWKPLDRKKSNEKVQEYSSMQIIEQLTPHVRESMLADPKFMIFS